MAAKRSFVHYQDIRHRLPPSPLCHHQPEVCDDVLALSECFDTFLFDAFGVLNVGQHAIINAPAQVAELRAQGKNLFIVSNAASYAKQHVVTKFRRLGFDFGEQEIITSRDALLNGLHNYPDNMRWGLIAPHDGQEDLHERGVVTITQDDPDFLDCDGFLFLSSLSWDDAQQQHFVAALHDRPRPILLGNPDLIAPMGDHSSTEPGSYVLCLEDHLFDHAKVFGKPFAEIFNIVAKRLEDQGKHFDHARTLMLGDTLHTDILGGNAYGIATALVSGEGFFRGLDPLPYIEESGIVPDYLLPRL
ncbi:HAD hydrolase-like protein [Suttonella sp. R2A3]|uniref:HAD-IIA family hydrolase n=1 Tax=Suttonella sp. R2A3 TaxID=2908648 RepID=UPI001F257AE9|nr:HAD hydrolase-like protein [Suttonella sp. R2A3]UJF23735.1 HAD hydrolase-like protein [Suttonella sp. R2A3]